MGVISHPTNFFGHGAAQDAGNRPIDDQLELAILKSQRKDAAIAHRALDWLVHWLMGSESKADDSLEQAILACKRRDAAIVRHFLVN